MTAATNAPGWLGSGAATSIACEVDKLLGEDHERVAYAREVLTDWSHHRVIASALRRNDLCHFDHECWTLEPADVASLEAIVEAHGPGASLAVAGQSWIPSVYCPSCENRTPVWRLTIASFAPQVACATCGAACVATGFDEQEAITLDAVPAGVRQQPVSELGLRDGDVLRIERRDGTTRHLAHRAPPTPARPGHVLIAGCGNIGSFAVPLVARLPGLVELTLCDHDSYEPHQVAGQNILLEDVGRNKAVVQAERVAAIAPQVVLHVADAPLESLPWSAFRGASVVSALDSRLARVHLAERAWRMSVPFVDSAVEASSSLTRVEVYRPRPGEPCFECAFDSVSYEALAHEFRCDGQPGRRAGGAA